MRKAFLIALLAAGTAIPSTAMAQDGENWQGRPSQADRQAAREARQGARQSRQQVRQDQPVVQQRAERQERRQERQEQRQENRQERSQQSGQGWMGDPNDPRMEEHRRRYERLDRQNARENGSRQQYRDLVQQQGSQREARREERQDRREWREERRDDRQDWRNDRREWRDDRRDDRRDWRQDRRDDRRWNRGWRNDNRYDWQRYRNSNRFVFRVQPYYAPYRGYGYSRFGIGQILDRLLWGQNYWIRDPWQYRLPPAPYGYQWVRYYNDVVLVDTYNGQVVDVIYDFFW